MGQKSIFPSRFRRDFMPSHCRRRTCASTSPPPLWRPGPSTDWRARLGLLLLGTSLLSPSLSAVDAACRILGQPPQPSENKDPMNCALPHFPYIQLWNCVVVQRVCASSNSCAFSLYSRLYLRMKKLLGKAINWNLRPVFVERNLPPPQPVFRNFPPFD